MTTNKLDLAAIKARHEAATEGPWEYGSNAVNQIIYPSPALNVNNKIASLGIYAVSDCEFIIHAKTDIPALCDEVEKLQKEVAYLRKRDCNVSVQLCYNDGVNPFAREDLQVVDWGISDNCCVVESKTVTDMFAEVERLKKREGEYADLLASANNDVKRLTEYIGKEVR